MTEDAQADQWVVHKEVLLYIRTDLQDTSDVLDLPGTYQFAVTEETIELACLDEMESFDD